MTFEEFFIKKKIDLKALQAADGPLFEEFKAHYSAMGEKSFDHSKKFWFNKLRKSFHLTEEETLVTKPIVKQIIADTAPDTSGLETAKPAGFKPRFKVAAKAIEDEAKVTSKEETADSTEASLSTTPTGFRPRFKAGVTKAPDVAPSTSVPEEKTDDPTATATKPTGFKPRFKAGVTKAPDAAPSKSVPEEKTDDPTATAPKPTGFKPRFKAGVTKTETSEPVQKQTLTDQSNPIAPTVAAPENSSSETQEPTANKPTGFKPRFKAGITKIDKKEE